MSRKNDRVIVFLNGTSSAGKTSIAKELLKLDYSYKYKSIDSYISSPENQRELKRIKTIDELDNFVDEKISKFNNLISKLYLQGNKIIVDYVLTKPEWSQECEILFSKYPVLLVGVKCPLEVVSNREKKRGDRILGTAKSQFDMAHSGKSYDLEIDTSQYTPSKCAQQIQEYLLNNFTSIKNQNSHSKFC
jgi:chloramphenicol 3-O phosphotransferase